MNRGKKIDDFVVAPSFWVNHGAEPGAFLPGDASYLPRHPLMLLFGMVILLPERFYKPSDLKKLMKGSAEIDLPLPGNIYALDGLIVNAALIWPRQDGRSI